MHWSVEDANAILALRCCHLSRYYEDSWERLSEPEWNPSRIADVQSTGGIGSA